MVRNISLISQKFFGYKQTYWISFNKIVIELAIVLISDLTIYYLSIEGYVFPGELSQIRYFVTINYLRLKRFYSM